MLDNGLRVRITYILQIKVSCNNCYQMQNCYLDRQLTSSYTFDHMILAMVKTSLPSVMWYFINLLHHIEPSVTILISASAIYEQFISHETFQITTKPWLWKKRKLIDNSFLIQMIARNFLDSKSFSHPVTRSFLKRSTIWCKKNS